MNKHQFEQLVENIKIDGRLTGAVTCYQVNPDDPIEILSGHHRVEAAIEAGVAEIDAIVITTYLDPERKTAIQLSHNAITGQDDLAILGEMYLGLDLAAKKFSGLDDDAISSFDKVDLSGISAGSIKYQAVTFHFLPEDTAQVEAHLDNIAKAKSVRHHAAHIETFDTFFETIVRTKRVMNVQNSATAMAVLVKLATERLNQIENQQNQSLD